MALDTLYAEGQRLYSETFSAYARQFLDRQDRPAVRRIESVLPAVAVRRKGAVRTARATVGTLIEATYALEHLFARAARRRCDVCGELLVHTGRSEAVERIFEWAQGDKVGVTAPLGGDALGEDHDVVEEVLLDLLAAGHVRVLVDGRVVRLDERRRSTSEGRGPKKASPSSDEERLRAAHTSRAAEASAPLWGRWRGRFGGGLGGGR